MEKIKKLKIKNHDRITCFAVFLRDGTQRTLDAKRAVLDDLEEVDKLIVLAAAEGDDGNVRELEQRPFLNVHGAIGREERPRFEHGCKRPMTLDDCKKPFGRRGREMSDRLAT